MSFWRTCTLFSTLIKIGLVGLSRLRNALDCHCWRSLGFGVKSESPTSTQSNSTSAAAKPTTMGSMPGSASASSVSPTGLLPEESKPSSATTSEPASHANSSSTTSSTSSAGVAAALDLPMFGRYIVVLCLCLLY